MSTWIRSQRTILLMSALAAAPLFISTVRAAPQQPTHKATANPRPAKGTPVHAANERGHGVKFRPPKGAAAKDAKRLGALAGKECSGRADMQRNEHQWVVLCSNGKTFVVEPAAPQPATPAECSLAGTGPQPPCFP
jgi:hypothetical protein